MISYTGMTLIDIVWTVVLSLEVYDISLYENPDCKEQRKPCEVSNEFLWVVIGSSIFFLVKALGLFFSCYRFNSLLKVKEDDKVLREKLNMWVNDPNAYIE